MSDIKSIKNLNTPDKLTKIPLQLRNVNFAGICAESVEATTEGQQVNILTRIAITSDEILFHSAMESITSCILKCVEDIGCSVSFNKANTILLVIHENETAELWVDSVDLVMNIIAKKSIKAGSLIFEHEIADIIGVSFPNINFHKTDKIIYIFRESWRFGMYCDFNNDQKLDIDLLKSSLGALYRNLKFRHLYDLISNDKEFDKLLKHGWFPFVEIATTEFKELSLSFASGFDIASAEKKLIETFDKNRIKNILERWGNKPHFFDKKVIFEEALDNFLEGKYISTIKIILTEIEGVLSDAYFNIHGERVKIKNLLEFAIKSAENKARGSNTLMLPKEFSTYLSNFTFANFDLSEKQAPNISRHSVGHGAAKENSYNEVSALQAILTLDQIAFYT